MYVCHMQAFGLHVLHVTGLGVRIGRAFLHWCSTLGCVSGFSQKNESVY